MEGRVVIYGAGAIGGQIAVRLTNGGFDPLVVEPWAPQREALVSGGITLHTQSGEREHATPQTIGPDHLQEPVGILLLCVKSFDTLAALDVVAAYLTDDAIVVSLQNSINEEWIAPVVGAERLVGGVILINGSFLQPGHVQASSSVSRATASADLPGVYVGEYGSAAGAHASTVATVLNHVWPSVPIDDLLHERWSKMVNNTMLNPISAIGGMKSAALLANGDARRIGISLASEVLQVAEAEGHPLGVIMGEYAAADVYAGAEGRSDVVEQGLAERAGRVSPEAMTSMYQDVQRKRLTEIDYFSGLVSKKGQDAGIPAPFCDAVTDLVHQVEAGQLMPSPEALREVFRSVEN